MTTRTKFLLAGGLLLAYGWYRFRGPHAGGAGPAPPPAPSSPAGAAPVPKGPGRAPPGTDPVPPSPSASSSSLAECIGFCDDLYAGSGQIAKQLYCYAGCGKA